MQISKRSISVTLAVAGVLILFTSFQNCSDPVVAADGVNEGASTSNLGLPTATIQASPSIWRVGSSENASIQYTTSKATSVSGYHIFTGTCQLGQSQGGQRLPWTWVDTIGSKNWSTSLSGTPARDDRGCTIRYCVVATNAKGSSEACANVQIVDNNVPVLNLTMSPTEWRVGSNETLTANYTVTNATSTRGYQRFQGTCEAARTYINQDVPWEFGNNPNGNSWTGTAGPLAADQRDDRGCTITYCVVATNAAGSVENCVPIHILANTPRVEFNVSSNIWTVNAGQSVTVSYRNTNATASRGYHVFEGSCALAQQSAGRPLAWEFANNREGNTWTGTPTSTERDDRGCTIRYCVVASNNEGSTEACKTVTVQ